MSGHSSVATVLLLILFAWVLRAEPARAADVVVTLPCTETSLRDAVEQAGTYGTISFACPETNITLQQPIRVADNHTIVLDGEGGVTLSGGGASRLFEVESGAHLVLQRITLQQGYSASGGGAIINSGELTIENSRLISNVAAAGTWGGAILSSGTLTMTNSELRANRAQNGGSIAILGPASALIEATRFEGNRGTPDLGRGGALFVAENARLTIRNSAFLRNLAHTSGALSVEPSAAVTVTGSLFQANRGTFSGGAVSVSGLLDVNRSRFIGNHAPWGGAFRVSSTGTLAIEGSTLSDGTGTYSAAISNAGTLFMHGSMVARMVTSEDYGAIDNTGLATLINSSFLDNQGVDANSIHNHTVTSNTTSSLTLIHVSILGRVPGGLAEIINNGDLTSENSVYCTTTSSLTCFQGAAPEARQARSLGGNHFSDQGCMDITSTDIVDVCVPLVAASEEGGLDFLRPASNAAVDAVACVPEVRTDARGVARPQGERCDAGALELDPREQNGFLFIPLAQTVP